MSLVLDCHSLQNLFSLNCKNAPANQEILSANVAQCFYIIFFKMVAAIFFPSLQSLPVFAIVVLYLSSP